MSDPRLHDPRIVQALLLLQDALRRPSAGPAAPAAASDDDWLVSSTDILTPWYPEHAAAGSGYIPGAPPAAAWDAYFAGLAPSFVQPNDGLDRLTPVPEPESLPFDAGEPSRAALAVPLEPQAAIAESDQSAAEAVIEALYGFVHAIARADVPAAMRWVASDYHSMEDDREVTFETLQQQLEDLVDARRDRSSQRSSRSGRNTATRCSSDVRGTPASSRDSIWIVRSTSTPYGEAIGSGTCASETSRPRSRRASTRSSSCCCSVSKVTSRSSSIE